MSNQNIVEVQLAADPHDRLEARVRQRADDDVGRTLAMTDDEIYAEVIAKGKDPKEVAAEVQAILKDAIVKYQDRRKRTMEIPISAAKEIAEKYDYDQVIIIARKVGRNEHVTTYGANREHCDIAAQCGEFLKYKVMGWHDENAAGRIAERILPDHNTEDHNT